MSEREHFKKLKLALRSRLLGLAMGDEDWCRALEAFDYVENIHTGFRKDGETPEFMHQIQICLFLMQHYKSLTDPIGVIVAALLHDTPEDYHVDFQDIEHKFGKQAMYDVRCLTKKYKGAVRDKQECFDEIALSQNASIVKGADRVNNISTMIGVFSEEKIKSYCEETREYFFTFLKKARRMFPKQDSVYENIKFCLEIQLKIYEGLLK
jgi:guanosine-3',5'-bis(diphosphate) 3'-pyrophosphohydrolase